MKGESEQFQLGVEYCDSSVEWIPLEGIKNAMMLFAKYRAVVRTQGLISLTLLNSSGATVKKYAVRN